MIDTAPHKIDDCDIDKMDWLDIRSRGWLRRVGSDETVKVFFAHIVLTTKNARRILQSAFSNAILASDATELTVDELNCMDREWVEYRLPGDISRAKEDNARRSLKRFVRQYLEGRSGARGERGYFRFVTVENYSS